MTLARNCFVINEKDFMWRSKNSHIDETTMRRLDSASSEVHQPVLMCLVEEILGNHFRDLPFMVNRASNASGNLALVLVAICTGLRVSEILALRWSRIHFDRLTMIIKVKAVNGRIGRVKTECAEDELPLDPDFAAELLDWKAHAGKPLGIRFFRAPSPTAAITRAPFNRTIFVLLRWHSASKASAGTRSATPIVRSWTTLEPLVFNRG
jgi:integrase